MTRSAAILTIVAWSSPLPWTAAQQAPRPLFRTAVDVVALEVQVVDDTGRPVPNLGARDFQVHIDGRQRPVVSAQFVPVARAESAASAPIDPRARTWINRLFVVAIDEPSFRPGDATAAAGAARSFIDALAPSDYVATFRYPQLSPRLAFTSGRAAAKATLVHVAGRYQRAPGEFDLSASEIVDLNSYDKIAGQRIVSDQCQPADRACPARLSHEAHTAASLAESEADSRIAALSQLLGALAEIPGRKTVVILSAGLLVADRASSRPRVPGGLKALGRDAALSNTMMYVVHLDSSFFAALDRERRGAVNGSIAIGRSSRDGQLLAFGLEHLSGSTGGAYFNVAAGAPGSVFGRVLRESSAYYLLGVEPSAAERDGEIHYLRVRTNVDGVTVRSRSQIVIPRRQGR
jgi:VWFA-related protein